MPSEESAAELPLIAQLKAMGWTHLPATADGGEPAERDSRRAVVLRQRLRNALYRINTDNGQPWLDDQRLSEIVNSVLRPSAKNLLEINQELTALLIGGTTVRAPEDSGSQRDRHIDYIDWDHPERNDFVVMRQFVVELPGGQRRRTIKPDLVLFVNGLPLVVIETKAPHEQLTTAMDQLRRYADQREPGEVPEGSERLFRTNQLVIASNFDQAKAGTFTSALEHFAAWKTVEPASAEDVRAEVSKPDEVPLSQQETLVAGMLRPDYLLDLIRHFTVFMNVDGRTVKVVARYQQYRAVRRAIHRLRTGATKPRDRVRDRRGGIVWHTQGSGKSLTMVFLVRFIRELPDLTAFKIVAVTDRTQLQDQLSDTAHLSGERPSIASNVHEAKEILSRRGKDFVFVMMQKWRDTEARTSSEAPAQRGIGRTMPSLGELNPDEKILVLIDEAHRSQASDLHASMEEALPNAALIGFTGTPIIMGHKKRTEQIFGEYIDSYRIKESQQDGATLPILYEGKSSTASVREAGSLDELFDEWLADLTEEQKHRLKQRYATKNAILEAPELINRKAQDMLWHYVESILPNEFKAQVVAVSRKAAVRYRDGFLAARDDLLRQIETLTPGQVSQEALDHADELPERQRRLVRAHQHRDLIEKLDFVPVFSGEHNDPESYRAWTNPAKQDGVIRNFKKKLPSASAGDDPKDTSPIAFLIVNSMLLTGFDAPVEQVLYLDRHMKEDELLQAVARVNRTSTGKRRGHVVDYYGIAANLQDALAAYAAEDVEGALGELTDELQELRTRAERLRQLFARNGIHDIAAPDDVEACVQLFADQRLRGEFETALRLFADSVESVMPRAEARPFLGQLKTYGLVRFETRRRYRDDTDEFDPAQYGGKVRELIDAHITALGIRTWIPPVSITAEDFDEKVGSLRSPRARAAEMEHAIRHYISENFDQDPVYYESLAERLRQVLAEFDGRWDEAYAAMQPLAEQARQGRQDTDDELDPKTERPFFELMRKELQDARGAQDLDRHITAALRRLTVDVVDRVRQHAGAVGFLERSQLQIALQQDIHDLLDGSTVDGADLFEFERLQEFTGRIVQLAKANHARLLDQG